jgi:hypothetical protein
LPDLGGLVLLYIPSLSGLAVPVDGRRENGNANFQARKDKREQVMEGLTRRNLADRPDGMLKRPTPNDDNYQPKPLRQAIAAAFRSAPARA